MTVKYTNSAWQVIEYAVLEENFKYNNFRKCFVFGLQGVKVRLKKMIFINYSWTIWDMDATFGGNYSDIRYNTKNSVGIL